MIVVVALFFALALFFIFPPYAIVGPGERGVVVRLGAVQPVVLGEGLHFIMPFVTEVVIMDVKLQKSQTDAAAASSDIQETHSTIALNFRISAETANIVYQEIGRDFKSRVIDPAVQEVVKAVTARYTAVDLITKREKVRTEIMEQLKKRLAVYNISVVDFAIINFEFSKEFSVAIEAKQTAEQLALKAERDLDRIKIEAEQKITQARAEAEGLRLQKQNVSADLIKLRQIEATIKAIEKWDGKLPSVTGGAVPFIDAKSYQ